MDTSSIFSVYFSTILNSEISLLSIFAKLTNCSASSSVFTELITLSLTAIS